MNYQVVWIRFPKNRRKREIYILIEDDIILYSIGGLVVYKDKI